MVTLVVKDNTISPEEIQAFIKKEGIEGEYEVITQAEYEERRKLETVVFPYELCPQEPRISDLTAEFEARERKERKFLKDQQKWRNRYYNRRK